MNNKSPYTAITGCSFLFYEFKRMLPILMSENSAELLAEEIQNNDVLQVNSIASRKRFIAEFKRRYASVPPVFWEEWSGLSEEGQRAGLLYAILKTYKLVFDVHINVTLKKWNSVSHILSKDDVSMEINEISAKDEYVGTWSDETKNRCASQYLTILRHAGMLSDSNELQQLRIPDGDYAYYIAKGEEWFMEACLLYPYEINTIKENLK